MKYKVTDPKGIFIDGESIDEGCEFEASHRSAEVKAALHFQQISPVAEKTEKVDKPKGKGDK